MRLTPALPALLALCLAVPAAAQSTRYDVEIIVFEHLEADASGSERWRPEVVVPQIADAAAFEPDGPRAERLQQLPEGFERLSPEQAQLGDAVKKLNDSRRYRVLRHSIWRQPALERDQAVALRFAAGEPMTLEIPASAYPAPPEASTDEVAGTSDSNSSEMSGGIYRFEQSIGEGILGPRLREAEVLPLDGTIKLVVSRYLHLHADLYFTTDVHWRDGKDAGSAPASAHIEAAASTESQTHVTRGPNGRPLLSYAFQQQRRMRSGELHYLDHPVVGLLVKVTPYEPGQ